MTSQPTMDSFDVEALLDIGEKRALEQASSTSNPKSDGTDTDPRRLDRPRDDRHDVRSRREHDGDRSSRDRYLNDRDDNDERRARRSRDNAADDHRGGSDKDSANGSVRSRRRSRSPRSEGPRSHRSRERTSSRHYGRSSSPDDRHYRPGADRHGRDRHPGRRPSPRRPSPRRTHYGGRDGRHGRRRTPPRHRTPEPTDDERDRRTVFVQQLAAHLRDSKLKEFFEKAGPVVDAQIVKDRVNGRSKGVGYVEFKDEESVKKAIQLTGQKLMSIPIIVQLTEAEKNRQARTNEGGATQTNGVPFHRLYVGNIHFSITEADLKNVFEPFGELEFVQLQKEDGGRSKGYGFVQFVDADQAKEALEKMNGFELAGRPIRVGLGNDKFTPESTQALLQRHQFNGQGQGQGQGSSFSGMGGRGAHAGGTGNFDRSTGRDDKVGGASALDDSDVSGVNFNNYSRDALMRKLARTDEPEEKIAPKTAVQPKKPVANDPNPTRCILIKHAYDQNDPELEDDWQESILADVRHECEEKYDKVVHIALSLDNNDGEIYVKFATIDGGLKAYRGLNGRNFDYRRLTVTFIVDAIYNMNFQKAAKV